MNIDFCAWCFFVVASGFVPLVRAWTVLGRTTLRPALAWALVTWGIWCLLAWAEAFEPALASSALRYLALSLTACTGVAVLGARRPGLGAWNFVLVGLLFVLLLPLAEGFGQPQLGSIRILFLGSTIALALLNYLPTRLGPAAVAVAIACERQLRPSFLLGERSPALIFCLLGIAPWLGWVSWHIGRPAADAPFGSTWRDFRDRYGWFWAQRMREQFNRAVANAGLPFVLSWRGLDKGTKESEPLAILQALLKRFDAER